MSFSSLSRYVGGALAAVWAMTASGAGEAPGVARRDFSVVALPDTQWYSEKFPATFPAQTAWIVSNRAPQNIVFVTHLGDLVQTAINPVEWECADRAMSILDGQVTYSVCRGNHDVGTADYPRYFGGARYAHMAGYLGCSSNSANHAQTFRGGGYEFLHIAVDYGATGEALPWAQAVLRAHPGWPTIVSTHDYMGLGGKTPNGWAIWESLIRRNPQIFVVLNGHVHGEYRQVATNDAGRAVLQMLSDYQDGPNGGDGYLRILRFNVASNRLDVRTYSPVLNAYSTNASSRFSYSMLFGSNIVVGGSIEAPTEAAPVTSADPARE